MAERRKRQRNHLDPFVFTYYLLATSTLSEKHEIVKVIKIRVGRNKKYQVEDPAQSSVGFNSRNVFAKVQQTCLQGEFY